MECRTIVLISVLLLIHHCVDAQNFFSQHYSSPLTINPANTGNFSGDFRLGGIARNEKEGLPQSTSKAYFFGDTRLLHKVVPENDKFAVGFGGLSEKNAFYGIKNTYLSLSLAYQKALDRDGSQQLGIGFLLNFSHLRIESPSLVMENQLRGLMATGFSTGNPDQNGAIDINFPDINTGIRYKYTFQDKDVLTAGFSIYHANRPFRTYNGGQFRLSPQSCGQLGWEHIIDDRSKLMSALIVSDNNGTNAGDLFVSSMYDTRLNESNIYRVGLGGIYRKNAFEGSAVLPCLSLHFYRFDLLASYEVDVSHKTASQRGAFEVGLIYTGVRRPDN